MKDFVSSLAVALLAAAFLILLLAAVWGFFSYLKDDFDGVFQHAASLMTHMFS